ncbi:MAG TPA: DNA repair protein RadA, partial [Spirochaetia bacterium]|nr:DNA repair protein RadA [Spirochaetia bacterium]
MKQALVFICSACGADHAKWAGRCRVCGSWNTLEETKIVKTRTAVRKTANPQTLVSVNSSSHPRLVTGLDEVDLLFGGGLVQGSVYLLTGEPGTGKSTMLLELSRNLPGKILYIAGEETEFQIKERFDRLGIKNDRLFITRETCAESLIELVNRENFNILFIDSIQMLSSSAFENTPGSVVQVRTCACLLINVCKEKNITCIFTGHITKDGTTAGPKIIEHAVDGTVYMYPEAIDS